MPAIRTHALKEHWLGQSRLGTETTKTVRYLVAARYRAGGSSKIWKMNIRTAVNEVYEENCIYSKDFALRNLTFLTGGPFLPLLNRMTGAARWPRIQDTWRNLFWIDVFRSVQVFLRVNQQEPIWQASSAQRTCQWLALYTFQICKEIRFQGIWTGMPLLYINILLAAIEEVLEQVSSLLILASMLQLNLPSAASALSPFNYSYRIID